MSIQQEQYRAIRQLYNQDHSIREISRMLNCTRQTVKKYCEGAVLYDKQRRTRNTVSSVRGSVESEILKIVEDNRGAPRKQQMTAKDIWVQLYEKGYAVGESTVRRYVREMREKLPDAFIPLSFDPGEVIQVDWGDMSAWIAEEKVNVSVFIAILPFSYGVYAGAFPDKTNPCFHLGHVQAFEYFGGPYSRPRSRSGRY